MTIQNRFADNLISSTKLNPALVAGLGADGVKGPITIPVGLDQIAQSIDIKMAKAPESASHARPSMLGSISSFAENVKTALDAIQVGKPAAVYANLSSQVKQDFKEWQGMVAAVALNHVYSGIGLNLTIAPMVITPDTPAYRCALMEMDKENVYKKAVVHDAKGEFVSGTLFYICQNGKPFAIFHPEIGLCAMKNYDGSIFDGVLEWYDPKIPDCHRAWYSIAEPGGTALLDDFCLSRIAWWAAQNGLKIYQQYIKNHQHDPSCSPAANLVSPKTILNAGNIDTIWPYKGTAFGTTMMFCSDANGAPQPLPRVFLDTLLITLVGSKADNRLIYNTSVGERSICFRKGAPELAGFAPVAPLRREFVELLDVCTLERILFDEDVVGGKVRAVTVTVDLRNSSGEVFHMRKTYGAAGLRQGRMPYLMIWPFMEMPAGMDLWQHYCATWHDQTRALTPLKDTNDALIGLASGLTFDFGPNCSHQICRPTAPQQRWTVCTGTKPFRYAMLLGKDGDRDGAEMGMVFIPNYPTFNPNDPSTLQVNISANTVKLAIDFGTTSTVCALRTNLLAGGAEIPLPFRDYSRTVTCEDVNAKETLDVEHWLGNTSGGKDWKWDRKLFSVAQLFDRLNEAGPNRTTVADITRQDYYVDGRLFLASGTAMQNFASAARGSDDPLRTQLIMNDMKFNENLDIDNYYAASVFLAGVYMYAILYLLSNKVIPGGVGNVPYLEMHVSYPNDVTLNALKKSWVCSQQILGKIMAPVLTKPISDLLMAPQNFFSEAVATTAYQRRNGSPLQFVPNLVSLDIGGGTTDISITSISHPDEAKKLSVRYAGRDMMVSTLISYFRKFSAGSVIPRNGTFESLWNNKDIMLLTLFETLCDRAGSVGVHGLKGLTANSSLRMNVELLLADGMTMTPAGMGLTTDLLRQLIALKFIMVLMITARCVRENIDMWYDPATGKLTMADKDHIEINLSVSGASAQMLQYVFDTNMKGLASLNANPNDPKMELFNELFDNELQEVLPADVHTRLQIYVDANVKEKREVCYGMLQPGISLLKVGTADGGAGKSLSDDERAKREQETKKFLTTYKVDKLEEYLHGTHGLLYYAKQYEDIILKAAVKANNGLGNVIQVSSMLENDHSYSKSCMAIAQMRSAYMVEDEQKPYRDLLACTYLVDEILDWEMAALQQ